MLKVIKIYGSFCMAQERPIGNWTEVTKAEFDEFRCGFNASVPSGPKQDLLSDFCNGINVMLPCTLY